MEKISMKIKKDLLHAKITKVLIANGISDKEAHTAADVLIEGNLRNYVQHGINRIFQILDGLKNKTINHQAKPKIVTDLPSISVIDGDFGLGYDIGKQAMELAIQKSKQVGVGVVGVINSSHLGILDYYSEIASKNGCIGVVMSTTSPAVVVKGGKIKTFGTNPISYSIPSNGYPITADFATSKVARGTIYSYLNEGKNIPHGWAVDSDGQNTTDPKKALNGGLMTIDGDIKGSLLSLWVSIMAGNLIGGVSNINVTGTRYMDKKPNKGDLFMAFNIESFTNKQAFIKELEELKTFINKQEADFKVPGERDYKYREQSLHDGIDISEELVTLLDAYE